MPLDRVAILPLDAPGDHADGRRRRSPLDRGPHPEIECGFCGRDEPTVTLQGG